MKMTINRITELLGSRRFFRLILGFFVLEAVWIALSAVYPMAFDESFHFGIIKIYSHHWLPFLSGQPAGANAYGAVARDPSYLYHYLMSFPYRLVSLVFHEQTGQVIALRLIDIGLFATGLALFRKVLLRAKISSALANVSLLLFVLIPIVPQLAAHISYDDLLFPLVALLCLLTFRAYDELKSGKPFAWSVLMLLAVGLLGTQVKYAFAPIFAGALLFLAFATIRSYRHRFKKLWSKFVGSWRAQTRLAKTVLIVMALLSCGLFIQRDGYNLIKYHAFTPDCATVLNVKSCEAYGPWAHNYKLHNKVLASKKKINYENPIFYLGSWTYWMWYRSFFAINGQTSGYTNYPPLPLVSAAAALVGLAALVAVVAWRRRIFHNHPYLVFFCFAIGLYIISLWVDGYAQYRYTNELVTMNGRYLLPILLLCAAIAGRAFSLALRDKPVRKAVVTLVVLLLFLQGGGVLTFIARSDSNWDWPNSTVIHINNAARKVTKKLVVHSGKYYATKHWFFN